MSLTVLALAAGLPLSIDDAEAVQLFNEYVEQYELLRQQMADGGFALTQTEAAICGRYTWLDDPWPWDAETEA